MRVSGRNFKKTFVSKSEAIGRFFVNKLRNHFLYVRHITYFMISNFNASTNQCHSFFADCLKADNVHVKDEKHDIC